MDKQITEELRKTLVDADSLISLLVHRHGKYLDSIGEKEEAFAVYHKLRSFSVLLEFATLPVESRTMVMEFMDYLLNKGR